MTAMFPEGTTSVILTATDLGGNTLTCSTTVTVTAATVATDPPTAANASCAGSDTENFPAGTWIIGMDNLTQPGTYVYPAIPV